MDAGSALKRSPIVGNRTPLATAIAAVVLTAALTSAFAGPAQAISQDFSFELTTVDVDLLGTGLQPGDMLQGNFSHSSCLTQSCRDLYSISSSSGYYYDLTVGLDLQLGGFQAESNAYESDIYVSNGPTYDRYAFTTYYGVGSGSISPLPTTILGETVTDVFLLQTTANLTLGDPNHNAFVSGYLPAELPPLSIFEDLGFEVHVYLDYFTPGGAVYGREVFSATALLPQVVPEPSTALLVAVGVAVAVANGRRRRDPQG